ncbi:hypothetical protein AURDEDRAFT_175343 [Auricularia subglabra TFB-10046 SS5]|nr:hypothetical protein AURDEDRAFT_175343 [Auricularia subglabra TFB-10046 SS5]
MGVRSNILDPDHHHRKSFSMSDQPTYAKILYTCVRNALECVATGLTSAECASLARELVLAIVNRAMSDFSEEWNSSNPHLLSPLPVELRASCFQWLWLRDRIALSHVSRGLRKTMLETPTLWDTVPATTMSYECATRLYREVLARSGSVGLDVRCPSSFGSPPLYDRICESMPRVRRLAIEYSPHSLLLQNRVHAPLLQALQLSSPESETDPRLPVQWIRNNAPRLRKLTSYPLVLPHAPQSPPLRNITVLDAKMHWSPVRGDLRTLFLVFPCLERLSICGVLDTLLLPQTPPPPSMRAVCLGSCITVAFAALLAQWASGGGTQCALTLNTGAFPPHLPAAVSFMAASCAAAPWEMALQWRNPPYCARLRQRGTSELEITLQSEYFSLHEGMQGLRRGGDLSGLYSMKVEGVALVYLTPYPRSGICTSSIPACSNRA